MSRFPEWPLAGFTALAIGGAGITAALQPLALAGFIPADEARWFLLAGGLLTTAGLLVAFAHLGRRGRAARAVAGTGHSALSQEVILGSLAAVSSLAAAFPSPAAPWLAMLAGLASILFLGAIGLVYRLPAQTGWSGAASATPLTAGLASGALVLAGAAGAPPLRVFASVLVLVDLVAFGVRWAGAARLLPGTAPRYPAAFAWRHLLLAARAAALDLLGLFLVFLHEPRAAIVAVAVGLLLDRLAFSALATGWSMEAEIARVEQILEK